MTGSLTQSGTLPSNPVVTIGGLSASVELAGLISPGLFQLNVVVPPSAANGDNAIVATYGGVSALNGLLLTVQRLYAGLSFNGSDFSPYDIEAPRGRSC